MDLEVILELCGLQAVAPGWRETGYSILPQRLDNGLRKSSHNGTGEDIKDLSEVKSAGIFTKLPWRGGVDPYESLRSF